MNDGTREVVIGAERFAILDGDLVRYWLRHCGWVSVVPLISGAVRRVAELEDALREAAEHHEEQAALGEPAPCQSTYRGSVCDLPAGHGLEHSCWVEGWGDLVWTDEQSEADYQRVVDFWRERGVTYPPTHP